MIRPVQGYEYKGKLYPTWEAACQAELAEELTKIVPKNDISTFNYTVIVRDLWYRDVVMNAEAFRNALNHYHYKVNSNVSR